VRLTFHHKNFHGLPCLHGTTEPVSAFGTKRKQQPSRDTSAAHHKADMRVRPCCAEPTWSPTRIGSLSRSAIERVRRKVKVRSEVFWRWRHSGWSPQDSPRS
jgi:hypothetical protein